MQKGLAEDDNLESIRKINPNVPTAIRTLTAGGFILESAERKPGFVLIHVTKYDEFGIILEYCFDFAVNCRPFSPRQASR
jgi:hypothetical protein